MAKVRNPSIPATSDDPKALVKAVQALKESMEIAQRLRGDPLDSFVRLRELQDLGILRNPGGDAGVVTNPTDHGALTGLLDDDHTQYFNQVRGDARYLRLTGGTLTGLLTSTGSIRTSESFRATGWNHDGASGPGAELGVSGGVAYLQSYNRTTLTFGVLNLQGSSVNLVGETGSNVLAATDSSVAISKFVEINTGTSMPLRLRVANSSAWALDLYRDDQAWSSKVFLHNAYGLGWHFEHTPSVDGLGPLLVMRNNAWLTSADGYNRFYFGNAGRTYFGSQNGYEWRDASDNTALMIEPGTNYLVPSSWIRLPINAGLYTSLDDTWYPDGSNYWIVKSTNGIRVRDRAGTDQGFLYHTGGGSFGLLDSGGNWRVRVNTGGVTLLGNTFVDNGIYWDQDTSFYIYNTSGYTYGSWRISGARGGYVGLLLEDGGKRPTFMSNNIAAGIYEQGISAWHYYCQSGLFRIGSSYAPYWDGGPGAILHHTGSQTSGRITVSTSGPSGTPADGDIWIQYAA